MAKPNKKAKRTVKKVSKKKGSDGKTRKAPAGSGSGLAGARKPAKDPRRDGGVVSALNALYPVGDLSIPVASELAKLGSTDNRKQPQRWSIPVYGNYCGRGHDDPTGKTPPVDAVDAVCREHNRCYRIRGDFDARCDRNLVKSMPSAIASTRSPIGKNAGILAMLYFSTVERNLGLGKVLFKKS